MGAFMSFRYFLFHSPLALNAAWRKTRRYRISHYVCGLFLYERMMSVAHTLWNRWWDDYWVMDWQESGRKRSGLILGHIPEFTWRDLGRLRKSSFRISCHLIDISRQELPNTSSVRMKEYIWTIARIATILRPAGTDPSLSMRLCNFKDTRMMHCVWTACSRTRSWSVRGWHTSNLFTSWSNVKC
jgi:hypothetical protein